MTYEDVTVRQAQGLACPRCNSLSGHYSVCPFINRATAEAREFVNKAEPTQADVIRLNGMAGYFFSARRKS